MTATVPVYSTLYARADRPRSLVKIGGQYIFAPASWRIEMNMHGASDSATVTLPISHVMDQLGKIVAGPDWSALTQNGTPFPIEIHAGFPPNPDPGNFALSDLNTRFIGLVDQILPSFGQDRVEFSCRSLAAILVDTKLTTAIQNATTIQVISQIAKRHGITLVSKLRDGQTPFTLAKLYAKDIVVGLRTVKEWDVILASAQADDVQVFLDGSTLYYVAPELYVPPILILEYGLDLKSEDVQHSPQFSKNIEVEVRSYEPKIRTAHRTRTTQSANGNISRVTSTRVVTSNPVFGLNATTESATTITSNGTLSTVVGTSESTGGKYSSGYTTTPSASLKEKYVFEFPHLTRQECADRALAIWKQISAHEFVTTFKRPMTPEMLSNVKRQTAYYLHGCPWPSINVRYYAKRITETFEVSQAPGGSSGGWEFEVVGVNHQLPTGTL